MDLDLLVIGATYEGWRGAVAAAQAGEVVGLVDLPLSAVHDDLRQIPSPVLEEACADWPLVQNTGSLARGDWREFAASIQVAWRLECELLRQAFLTAGGVVWSGSTQLHGPHDVTASEAPGQILRLQTRQLLIATGTHGDRPRFLQFKHGLVSDASTLLEIRALPREGCVIGGGVTGWRAATLLAWWGTRVSVVDGRSEDVISLDGEARIWANRAVDLGVRSECGEDVIGCDPRPSRGMTLTLESGRRLRTGHVFVATERRGCTAGLGLETAGLSVDERGRLWCDEAYRTWQPSIQAVGDVVGFVPNQPVAIEPAVEAVEVGEPVEGYAGYRLVPLAG